MKKRRLKKWVLVTRNILIVVLIYAILFGAFMLVQESYKRAEGKKINYMEVLNEEL